MKKASAIVLFAAMAICAATCHAGTITWGFDGDLGSGFQAGWLVQLYKDVNQDGLGGQSISRPEYSIGNDDVPVSGASTVLVSGKSGLNWGTTLLEPAGSLHLGDHVYTVIFNAASIGAATMYRIVDMTPFVLPAVDQDADYIMSSVSGWWPILESPVALTAMAGANGAISQAGTLWVIYGSSKTYSITATNDYMISDVLVDGSSVGPTNSYTFSNVTSTHTISATFAPILAAKGTPLWWLHNYGLTNDCNADEVADPDSDGLPTWQEYIAGTDPTNPASCFRISSLFSSDVGRSALFYWGTVSGRLYSVYSRTNLFVTTWTTNAWRIPASGSQMSYTNAPSMFFRLGVENQ